MQFSREQVLRLVEEQLHEYSLFESVKAVEIESKIGLEDRRVTVLRQCCNNGQTMEIIAAIESLIATPEDRQRARQYILQHQYHQLILQGKTMEAMAFLQHQITPISTDSEVRELTAKLMSKPAAVPDLFQCLSSLLPADLVVPNGRLQTLLAQAKSFQFQNCDKHDANVDLLRDEQCHHSRQIAFARRKKICHANQQIWDMQFSHDGKHLAYTSTNKTVHILSVSPDSQFATQVVLDELPSTPAIVSFSPDDTVLFVGFDKAGVGWLWSVTTKAFIWKITEGRGVSSMVWIDNQSFVCADQTLPHIRRYNVMHKREESRYTGIQAASLCLSNDQSQRRRQLLYAAKMCSNTIYCIDVDRFSILGQHELPQGIQIVGIMAHEHSLLVSCDDNRMRLLDKNMSTEENLSLQNVRIFSGHVWNKNIYNRPAIWTDSHVLLGSQDGRVYMWRIHDQCIVSIIGSAKVSVVTCVSCHPNGSFIGVGDNQGIVRIYAKK